MTFFSYALFGLSDLKSSDGATKSVARVCRLEARKTIYHRFLSQPSFLKYETTERNNLRVCGFFRSNSKVIAKLVLVLFLQTSKYVSTGADSRALLFGASSKHSWPESFACVRLREHRGWGGGGGTKLIKTKNNLYISASFPLTQTVTSCKKP